MAHILCVTGAERGLLHASCELPRRLVAAGHRVSLLAPAAASFDQYPDFERRGEDFTALVQALLKDRA